MARPAKLRVCASCEWIFKNHSECPKCGFAYYSAHYVYGDSAYRLHKTQARWLDKKMDDYETLLMREIDYTNDRYPE